VPAFEGRRSAGALVAASLILALTACGKGSDPVTVTEDPPAKPVLTVSGGFMSLQFHWPSDTTADAFRLLADQTGGGTFAAGDSLSGSATSTITEITVHRFDWANARFKLEACNTAGCVESDPISVSDAMAAAIGYAKASNTEEYDGFGASVALSSADGTTFVVGAPMEDSAATGVGGDEADDCTATVEDNCALDSGAVYVYTRSGTGTWIKQAYLKASNAEAGDHFGRSLALAGDGNTLVIGAPDEDSIARDQSSDNSRPESGAAYVFIRNGAGVWTQQAYLKHSTLNSADYFGGAVAISADGNTAAVGAIGEDGSGNTVNAAHDNSNPEAGAAYVFVRDVAGAWSQIAYVKPANPEGSDNFGGSVALSGLGTRLAVGAPFEESAATGVNGNATDTCGSNGGNCALDSGAAYVFARSGDSWSQIEYVKASNTNEFDQFGSAVALDDTGITLVVGAPGEQSAATVIDGDQALNTAAGAGAVYVFVESGGVWSQQAYVKPSNTGPNDFFGASLALSPDGDHLAVCSIGEDGAGVGIGGDDTSEGAIDSGAVYLFSRTGSTWSQEAYVKAANTQTLDAFGSAVAIATDYDGTADGFTFAVGAPGEDGVESMTSSTNSMDRSNNAAPAAGAVYLY